MVKKIFPKIKKSLQGFLTDESGKVTKKNVLGIAASTALLNAAVTNQVQGCEGSHYSNTSHNSGCSATSQGYISGYNYGGHVNRTLRGSQTTFSAMSNVSAHGSAVAASTHANLGPIGKSIYTGTHLNYSSVGGTTYQSSISGYNHSSGNSHSSHSSHSNRGGYQCP